MNIILLSGGSGSRLWPLSNEIRSKQFIKIFKNPDGQEESMLQRVYRQIHKELPDVEVTVAAPRNQAAEITKQISDTVDLCLEPCRRDTFPAVALACAYLHDVKKIAESEPIIVCPVDSFVDSDFFGLFVRLGDMASEEGYGITLLGTKPTYPSEKYGYIIPEEKGESGKVLEFHEKPKASLAEEYISRGALWSAGVFAFELGYMLEKAHEQINFSDYADLYDKYEELTPVAIDPAVVEKESNLYYLKYNGSWMSLGTWNTLTDSMEADCIGNAILDDACSEVSVVNELNLPILCMGLSDMVISASPEGILVSDKKQSSNIKEYVDKMDTQVMIAEKSWGNFHILDIDDNSMTIKVVLSPGQHMNYHSHEHRDEVWTVISGEGKTIVDGMEQPVRPGDVITMQAGCRHTVIAKTELQMIEVQLGRDIDVHDKRKYDYEF